MSKLLTRGIVGSAVASSTAAIFLFAPVVADAQVSCYVRKCLVFLDGSQSCERVPVDCSTIRPFLP